VLQLDFPFATTVTLTQNGTQLSGGYVDDFGLGPVSGSVAPQREVRFTVVLPGFAPFRFVGSADNDVDELTGQVEGLSAFDTWTLSRR
jgi:hypothetical protein